jgi:ankyrin repeat protein
MTCLHHACINGSVEIVSLLFECGSKIDTKDTNGYRPLHFACQYGKPDIAAALLRYGANPNEPTLLNNDTPMHLVVQHSPLTPTSAPTSDSSNTSQQPLNAHEKLLMLLLSHSGMASMSIRSAAAQQTPFELACELGKTRIIEIMIKYAVQSDLTELIRTHSSNSMHLACRNGHDEVTRMLLVHRLVDLNNAGEEGTALHEACRYGRYHTAKLLLEAGIDMNVRDASKQLAADVIIKQKIGNDLKCLLKGKSCIILITVVHQFLSLGPVLGSQLFSGFWIGWINDIIFAGLLDWIGFF